MTHPSLEARAVTCAFDRLKAVDDVSLSVNPGEVIALLGPSGSGKSTLLRLLAGLERPTTGEVFAGGIKVSDPKRVTPPEQRGLGMVFQDYALFPHLTALGNVAFGLRDKGTAEAERMALAWLSKVGLEDRARYFPHQLSGGEQQRVALARALAPQPRAILMDEPFSGLDPYLRADLQRTMLGALREADVAALIVSHDTDEALGIADQVAIMDHGKIIQMGVPSDVYNEPVSVKAARALGPVWTYAGRAKDGAVRTPFGTSTTKLSGDVTIAVRPEATGLQASDNGVFDVIDCRGVGRFVTVTAQGPDCFVQARIEARHAPPIGTKVDVIVAPSNAYVFAASAP